MNIPFKGIGIIIVCSGTIEELLLVTGCKPLAEVFLVSDNDHRLVLSDLIKTQL